MDTTHFRRLEELFTRAIAVPVGERRAIVDAAAASDPELGRELARLLTVESQGDPFACLVQEAGARLLAVADLPADAANGEPPAMEPASASPAAELMARLAARGPTESRYRLDGELARGGMGVVLCAFDPDLRRNLAMKVALDPDAPAGERQQSRTARFLEEAQITGQLDHPGIVPVHEIGLDAQGRPYFTMRLIGGRDLGVIYDLARKGADGWSTMRVLGVLLKVCEAVAYAHSKGVLHRDLKPANVMVGRFGEVYVMDWGLAKLIGEASDREPVGRRQPASQPGMLRSIRSDTRAADPATPLVTVDGTVLGTPAYMSPEQAAGDLAAIDVRADVYALGAMLYQLFAGHAPYQDGPEPRGAVELWQRVVSAPPTPLGRCAPSTPGELAAIVERAMAREPGERYPTMTALAEDLRAYTEGRVVGAYETGSWAELRKWLGRNRALSAALAAAVLAIAIGAIAFAVKADQAATAATAADGARHDAEQAALAAGRNETIARQRGAEAEASAARARKVTELVEHALGSDDATYSVIARLDDGLLRDDPETEARLQMAIARILHADGRTQEALPLAERALATHERLCQGDDAQLATSLGNVATYQQSLGHMAAALPRYERALAIRRRLAPDPDHDPRVADGLMALAKCHERLDRLQEALDEFAAAHAMFQQLLPVDRSGLASSLMQYANCLRSCGRPGEALPKNQEALVMYQSLFPANHLLVARSLGFVAASQGAIGHEDEALTTYREALAMLDRLSIRDHETVAECRIGIGGCLQARHQIAQAIEEYQAALLIDRRLYQGDHPQTAKCLNNIGVCLLERGDPAAALTLLRESMAMRQRLYPEGHSVLARNLGNVASCLQYLGHAEEARPMFQQSLSMLQRVAPEDHPELAAANSNLASCLQALGRPAEALPRFQAALELEQGVRNGPHPAVAKALNNVGCCQQAMGRHDEALAALRACLKMNQDLFQTAHPAVAMTLSNIGTSLLRLQRPAEALPQFETSRAMMQELHRDQPHHPEIAIASSNLGGCLEALNQRAAALLLFHEALAIREERFAPDHPLVGTSLFNLARCLHALGRPAEALPYADRASGILDRRPPDDPWRTHCARLLEQIRTALAPARG